MTEGSGVLTGCMHSLSCYGEEYPGSEACCWAWAGLGYGSRGKGS